ncbi:EAL domain-containing protein [Pseudoxanthomonas sp. NC8]|nr:EAL domain-containing protein [Pseudoxanthomonas sp. NC8]
MTLAGAERPPAEIACPGIEHLDNLMVCYGLPAQEALTAAIHRYLQPEVQAYTLGMGCLRFTAGRRGLKALLAKVEQFEFDYADAHQVRIEPHLGVSPLRDSDIESLETAPAASYGAMHAARQRGETAPVFATAGLSDPAAMRAVLETHSLALSLLRRRQLELHVQPIRRLSGTGAQMGEVLCRLRADDGHLLMPSDYMDELEASRGVVELDRAVVETLLAWMRDNAACAQYQRLTVNLTGRSLVSENFRNWLLYQLDMFPGCAERLCFEITERAITGGLSYIRPLLDGLSQRGCLIALDDFGTGMQSFERLQQLPIDLVKIDGTFVRNVATNPRDRDLI